MLRFITLLLLCISIVCIIGCKVVNRSKLKINADQTVVASLDLELDRDSVMMVYRQQQQAQRMRHEHEGDPDEGWLEVTETGLKAVEPAKKEQAEKPEDPNGEVTDAKLLASLKDMADEGTPQLDAMGIKMDMKDPVFKDDMAHIEATMTYPDLPTFYVMSNRAMGLPFPSDQWTLEKTDAGNLKLTISSAYLETEQQRQAAFMQMMSQASMMQGSYEHSLEMPGEIIESTWPTTQGNTTTFKMEFRNRESLEKLKPLFMKPTIIISKPSDFDLATLPIRSDDEASELIFNDMHGDEGVSFEELEVIDAPRGYMIEALSSTTTRVYKFEESKTLPSELSNFIHFDNEPHTIIRARIHPPRGRKLLDIASQDVEAAIDDQERQVKPLTSNNVRHSHMRSFMHGGREERESLDMEVRLENPELDAVAIEEISGSVTVLSYDKLAEYTVDKVFSNPNKAIAIDELVEGAKLTIKSVRQRKSPNESSQAEVSVSFVITGPKAIAMLSFDIEVLGSEWGHTYERMTSTEPEGNNMKKSITLAGDFQTSQQITADKLKLKISMPKGLKKEKIELLLEAIDLQ